MSPRKTSSVLDYLALCVFIPGFDLFLFAVVADIGPEGFT
jgi:hypothetical protein